MYEPARTESQTYLVTHVLNNNAVVVRSDAGISVLVGKGIGFGRKADDVVSADDVQEHYVSVEPDRLHYVSMLNAMDPQVLAVIAQGVEKAEDLLGPLHPSIYPLLTDHLAFAVERFREGATIYNNLLSEIRAVFPAEFLAAQRVLEFINEALSIDLPLDEAAFITLHLNAALSGDSVKAPLSRANALAELTEAIIRRLEVGECSRSVREALSTEVVSLSARLNAGRARACSAYRSIARELPKEWQHAEWILETLLGSVASNVVAGFEERSGETAYLAVFLHGWSHDAAHHNPSPQRRSLT